MKKVIEVNNIDSRTGNPKIILHLCACSGSDSQPYADAGYDVRIIGEDIGVENYSPPENVYGIIANPVCTNFSIAPGFHLDRNHEEGMFLVNYCIAIIQKAQPIFWVIENPASGKLKNTLGKPDFSYEPWYYGSPWTKKTALWGEFNIPIPLYTKWQQVPKIAELYIRPGRGKPSLAFLHKSAKKYIREFDCFPDCENDMEFRSLCSQKFAKAFFEANQ